MKEIKEKVRGQSPKIRNPASRLPKELVRSAMLEAKEKSSIMADKIGRETGEESPVEYAGNRIQRVEQRMGRESASAAYRGGKKLAVKTYEKIKAQKQKQREAATPSLGEENTRGNTFTQAGQTMAKKGRTEATRSIKVKPEAEKTIKEAGNRTVKIAPRVVKASPVSSQKVKTQAVLQKKQALKSMKAAREAKRAAMHSVQTAKQSAKATGRGLKAMAEAAAHAVKAAFAALMAGGGAVLVVLILIVGIIGGAAFLGNSQSSEALSAEVLAHTPAIQKYASEFGIPEYVPAIQAIMMQESGGRGTDPMQASECPYNTQYPNTPGAIQDADYSIKVGIQYYADCVREAGCESPQDMDKLKLSWQGYNYGNGYISWALEKFGGYSEANTLYLPVYLKQRVSVTDVMTDDAKVGDEVEITAQVNNLGEGMLYNVNARVEGKHVEKQETYIGNIDTGKSGNVDLLAKAVMVTDFEEMAKPEDWIIVTYEDRNGNKHEEKVDVSFYIETVDYEDLEVLKEAPEKTGPVTWQILLICACVLAVGVFVGVTINKKRSR